MRLSQIVERRFRLAHSADQWDATQLQDDAARILGVEVPAEEWFAEDGVAETEIEERLMDMSDRYMAEKAVRIGPETMRMAEKSLLLQVLDQQWKQHLLSLDQLRQGISLRAYAQKDPLNEYKREAFTMFESLLAGLRETVTMVLSHVEVRQPEAEASAAREAVRARRASRPPLPHRSAKCRATSLALVGQARNTSIATASLPDHQYGASGTDEMIKYQLICDQSHEFEGWFANSAAFEDQQKSGFLTCPSL